MPAPAELTLSQVRSARGTTRLTRNLRSLATTFFFVGAFTIGSVVRARFCFGKQLFFND
jgi:hypothetical protein